MTKLMSFVVLMGLGNSSIAVCQQLSRPNSSAVDRTSVDRTSSATTSSQMPSGRVTIRREFSRLPSSLAELIARASLIVEGLVDSSTIPARFYNTSDPASMETDIVFLVSKVYKGELTQKHFPRIVIAETGGTIGKLTVESGQHTMMQQGQRYVLFLDPETRTNLPSVAGLPRYIVTCEWLGKFKNEHGKISAPEKASGDLKALRRSDLTIFESSLGKASVINR